MALMYGFFSRDLVHKQKILHKQAAGSMEIYGKVAEAALQHVATDLMLRVRDYRLSIFLRDNNNILREELAKRFLDVAAAKGRYDQIRVIAARGKELIRVNYNNGQPEAVGQDKPTNKPYNFNQKYAEAWGRIKGEESGQINTNQGLFYLWQPGNALACRLMS